MEGASLLDELINDNTCYPAPLFDDEIDNHLFTRVQANYPAYTGIDDFESCAFDAVDWGSVFGNPTYPISLPPPSVSPSISPPSPLSPLSTATSIDDCSLPYTKVASDEQEQDVVLPFLGLDCAHHYTFGFHHQVSPSLLPPRPLSPSVASDGDSDTGRSELDLFATYVTAPATPPGRRDPALPPPTVTKRELSEDSDAEEYVEKKPTKRRRRQDTTRRFRCDECGSLFSRRHNLTMHVGSVHQGVRTFACGVPHCGQAFSRKHDLTRHHQSKHTDLGSPRRKQAAA